MEPKGWGRAAAGPLVSLALSFFVLSCSNPAGPDSTPPAAYRPPEVAPPEGSERYSAGCIVYLNETAVFSITHGEPPYAAHLEWGLLQGTLHVVHRQIRFTPGSGGEDQVIVADSRGGTDRLSVLVLPYPGAPLPALPYQHTELGIDGGDGRLEWRVAPEGEESGVEVWVLPPGGRVALHLFGGQPPYTWRLEPPELGTLQESEHGRQIVFAADDGPRRRGRLVGRDYYGEEETLEIEVAAPAGTEDPG